MHRGYVKLWRKSLDAGWLSNHKLWAFWCWCLLKATHKEHNQIVGCQNITLQPGEFIFGRKVAAFELKMSEQEIRTAVDSMRKHKNITIKSTNKFSVITIVNWDIYQSQEDTINQQINKPLTNNQPTTNHKQEHKNVKKEKKDIIKKDLFLDSVLLSAEEVSKLKEKFNGNFERAIAELNNYKMSSGKKYNSDYHALIGWVAKKFGEDELKKEAWEVD